MNQSHPRSWNAGCLLIFYLNSRISFKVSSFILLWCQFDFLSLNECVNCINQCVFHIPISSVGPMWQFGQVSPTKGASLGLGGGMHSLSVFIVQKRRHGVYLQQYQRHPRAESNTWREARVMTGRLPLRSCNSLASCPGRDAGFRKEFPHVPILFFTHDNNLMSDITVPTNSRLICKSAK